jgi:hypothetical protein
MRRVVVRRRVSRSLVPEAKKKRQKLDLITCTSCISSRVLNIYVTVTVNRCTSSSCGTVTHVAKLSGSVVSPSTIYTSSTGYMQVFFTSDGSVGASDFVSSFGAPTTDDGCKQCDMCILPSGHNGARGNGRSGCSATETRFCVTHRV